MIILEDNHSAVAVLPYPKRNVTMRGNNSDELTNHNAVRSQINMNHGKSNMESQNLHSIGVLGAGTWGIALARLLSNTGKSVTVWSMFDNEIEVLKRESIHPKLPNIRLPKSIQYTTSIGEACYDKDIILFAVPSMYIRSTAHKARQFIKDNQIVVDAEKGIEPNTLMTLTEVIADEVQNNSIRLAALSGPTHAEEVALDMPTVIVCACKDIDTSKDLQRYFTSPHMKVYISADIRGVEVCGALKNIIALAVGISSGIGYGDNTKAALITRGLVELSRLGAHIGCASQTFCGLAGMGDLIVTCTSKHSRNNKAGYLIGQGVNPKDAIAKVGMVVEGINTLPSAMKLAELHNVEMPIVSAVNSVVYCGVKPQTAVELLINREMKSEFPNYDDF